MSASAARVIKVNAQIPYAWMNISDERW